MDGPPAIQPLLFATFHFVTSILVSKVYYKNMPLQTVVKPEIIFHKLCTEVLRLLDPQLFRACAVHCTCAKITANES